MPIYEQRLQKDLTHIRGELSLIGERVETSLHNALYALFTHDVTLANLTILRDQGINHLCLKLDRFCHLCIVRHQPTAGHLRLISSVMRMVDELERIGDYAVTIGRAALHMQQQQPAGILKRDLEAMAQSTGTMLKQALAAVSSEDAQLARTTMKMAETVGHQLSVTFTDLESEEAEHQSPVRFVLDLFAVCYMLERVSDRAKNICEEALFMMAGESKPEKVFRILFIDRENSVRSQMAEAIARRFYPTQAIYSSAGVQPGPINQSMLDFMRYQGCPMENILPKPLEAVPLAEEEQIVISLEGPVRSYPLELHFHTTFLDWTVSDPPLEEDDAQTKREKYEKLYREITSQVRGLMEILRGEEVF
ncbi:MAG: phosphate signaling complex protein PhoU [Magnetococcales bacterium]|nr:phosphate signaling complex protein PhoU [Magnetococcales bacterium]